jgi:hypothetical protein
MMKAKTIVTAVTILISHAHDNQVSLDDCDIRCCC